MIDAEAPWMSTWLAPSRVTRLQPPDARYVTDWPVV